MENLIIEENGKPRTTPALNGEEITIKTPCDCTSVTGVQINGEVFPFYDTLGNSLENLTGLFAKNSLIRVLIDTDNTRAYILNADTNAYLEGRFNGKANTSHKHAAGDITSGVFGVARGGTGLQSLQSGCYLVGNGTNPVALKTKAQVIADLGITSGVEMKLLWTNASPASSFGAQTLSMDLSDYTKFILKVKPYCKTDVSYQDFITTLYVMCDKAVKCPPAALTNLRGDKSYITAVYRDLDISDTGFVFGEGHFKHSTNANVNNSNDYYVPIEIYGIKGVS